MLLLAYLLILIQTCNYFSFVYFVFLPAPQMGLGWQAGTQNEPTPKVRRTPMEDPFGKSQERPKVFRITSVVLLKDFGTKDLREVLPSNYFCATLWGVQLLPDGSIGVI